MFLRCTTRKKNGKEHRYWNLVENRRVAGGQVVQRQVLYLGEINDSHRESWCRTIEVFDEKRERIVPLALFRADRQLPNFAAGFGVAGTAQRDGTASASGMGSLLASSWNWMSSGPSVCP